MKLIFDPFRIPMLTIFIKLYLKCINIALDDVKAHLSSSPSKKKEKEKKKMKRK